MPEPFGPMMAATSPAFTVSDKSVEDFLAFDFDVEVFDFKHLWFRYGELARLSCRFSRSNS